MTNLYLIRHGEYIKTDDKNRLVDLGLSDKGRSQATRLAAHIHALKCDVLISSTMLRAKQTADIIQTELGNEIIEDASVEEWRNLVEGTITGEEFMANLQTIPPSQKIFRPIVAQCETWSEFMFRASQALNTITQKYAGKNIIIVCHGGIIEASFLFFTGSSILQPPPIIVDPDFTSVTHWELLKGATTERWKLVYYNNISHLQDPLERR